MLDKELLMWIDHVIDFLGDVDFQLSQPERCKEIAANLRTRHAAIAERLELPRWT